MTSHRKTPAQTERNQKENLIAQFWKRLNASPIGGKRKDFSEKYLSEQRDRMPGTKTHNRQQIEFIFGKVFLNFRSFGRKRQNKFHIYF